MHTYTYVPTPLALALPPTPTPPTTPLITPYAQCLFSPLALYTYPPTLPCPTPPCPTLPSHNISYNHSTT